MFACRPLEIDLIDSTNVSSSRLASGEAGIPLLPVRAPHNAPVMAAIVSVSPPCQIASAIEGFRGK